MKVMKFGGTSVGTVESINSVRNIVAGEQGALVVVVSALGGITNLLIKTANDAVAGGYEEGLSEIRKRHESVMSGVLPGGADDVKTKIGGLLSELATEYEQIRRLERLPWRRSTELCRSARECRRSSWRQLWAPSMLTRWN